MKEEQRDFVASNVCSLAEAYVAISNHDCIPMPFGIYKDEIMIGFVMLSYNEDEDEKNYCVWRFMIDQSHQGKGYAKKAMIKALEYVRTFPHGEAKIVELSYELENEVAKKLYASLGFKETGEIVDDKLRAILVL